jgi:penicillin-binding protein 2
MLGTIRTAVLASVFASASSVVACGGADVTAPKTSAPTAKEDRSARPARPATPAKTSLGDELASIVDGVPTPASVVILPLDTDGGFLVQEKDMRTARQSFRPGSTVKPLLAMLAADAGVLLPGAHHTCSGAHGALTCFAEHGDLDLARAISTSCNAYFYTVARDLGLERVLGGFRELGFGKKTGLSTDEVTGFVGDQVGFAHESGPSAAPEVDARVIGIGHGAFEATPLQLAVAYRTLVRRIAEARGQMTPRAEVYAEIERGLEAAVASEEGTGRGAQVEGLQVLGKTGTAEADPYGAPDEGRQNGWFVGYAPKDDPKLIVVALVRGAPQGGKDAALLAGRVFAAWQKNRSAGRPRAAAQRD